MYEYKVLTLYANACQETFNQLAKEGWRLVSMIPYQGGTSNKVIAAFERVIEE